MNFIKYITMLLLSFEPSYSDKETWEQRTARMELIATAIDDAASKATCSDKYEDPKCQKTWLQSKKNIALLLVTKGYWESRFAKNVHEGNCRVDECDSYRVNGKTHHRARSLWQIQKTGLETHEEYAQMNSSSIEATTMSANIAVRHLVLGMNKCRTILGTIALYGGAPSCDWSGAVPREAFYKRISSMSEDQVFTAADARRVKHQSKSKGIVFVTNDK
jgi:hypothetical protein